MAFNIFGDAPQSLTGLLGEQATEDLRKKALTTGLINAAIGYIAQPKTGGYGSALPYIGRALMAGQQGAQGVYEGAITDWERQQKIAEMKRQQQQRESFDVAAKNLYTTKPAQFESVTTPGGYAPQQAEVMPGQVSPNFGMTRLPDVTSQREIEPASQMLNQEALQQMMLSGDPRATSYLTGLKTLKDINTNPEGTPKVVGRSLVTPTGQVIYTDPNDTGLKAPPTRDRIVNGMTVQETMIGAPTPQNPEGVWKEIGRGARFKEEPPVAFDNQVLDFAAETYRKTGIMPSLGAGSRQMREAILTRAAQLNAQEGGTAAEGAEQLVANKATAAGILQLQKQKTMVGAFEKNALRNADIALKLSGETDRTGVPVFNRWIQAGQKSIAGNPTVSAFNAANETFVNEYAKIMSGSMGNTPVSDSARAQAHEMLATTQTKEQYDAVVKVLKAEMKNRMIGFEEELKEAKSSLSPRSGKGGLSADDKEALNWASKNPNDPRAKAIKQRLGL